MKKSFTIFIIPSFLLILLAFTAIKIHNDSDKAAVTLTGSFDLSGARIVSSEVYFWGHVEASDITDDVKAKAFEVELANRLGFVNSDNAVIQQQGSDLTQEMRLTGRLSNGCYTDITYKNVTDRDENQEAYIYVTVTEDLGAGRIDENVKLLKSAFKEHSIKPKYNCTITGFLDGRLTNDEMNLIAARIFKAAGARKVEDTSDGDMISVTAYSPKMGDGIRVNNDEVNLNLAIRYNSYEDKTYIWLATPVITTEY